MRDEIQYLREENRRKDEIIMQQAMTMRALSSPPEPSESIVSPADTTAERGDEEITEEPRRPWWQRIFGGRAAVKNIDPDEVMDRLSAVSS